MLLLLGQRLLQHTDVARSKSFMLRYTNMHTTAARTASAKAFCVVGRTAPPKR